MSAHPECWATRPPRQTFHFPIDPCFLPPRCMSLRSLELCWDHCPSIIPPRPTPTSAFADIVRCMKHPHDTYSERFNRSAGCGHHEPKCGAGTPPA